MTGRYFDITILIPTYNRAEDLRDTLEAMCLVERDNLAIEFVVIDNNSSDNTKEIVDSFVKRLPIRYLFEPKPGKSCALNKAINENRLGEIVVFTDDDVTPNSDWLKRIIETTIRWPRYDVFGGAIYSIWPDGQPPKWWGAGHQGQRWSLAGHGQDNINKKEDEYLYPQPLYPHGANFWVRKKIFDEGNLFDISFGRNTKRNVMGDDVVFFNMLRKKGYELVYSSYPVVGHRIQRELISPDGIRKRVISETRSGIHIYGLCHNSLLHRSSFLWFILRFGSLGVSVIRYLNPINFIIKDRGYAARLEALSDVVYNIESIKLGYLQTFKKK
jgi:glycosyltransferase involved in cell wall biosynthesis